MDSKRVKILDKECDWQRRGIKEAIWESVEPHPEQKEGAAVLAVTHLPISITNMQAHC